MKKFERITRLFVLFAALCFAISIGTAAASGTPSSDTSHSTAAEQAAAADTSHGEGSLSSAKLKDLFWRVINFIALMIILVKFGAKPIASGLAGRQKNVKNEIDELEKRKNDAEAQYREFEAKLSTVEKDIDSIVEKAVAQAEVEKSKIIEKAEQAADDIKRQAELAIQQEIMEARRTLKNDVADQAAAMAEELIVKNLKPEDQAKIIKDYLDKVGAVQ